MSTKRHATQTGLESCASESEKGILTPLRQVIRCTFASLFFPAMNEGRTQERTLSVFDGYTDKGQTKWKTGDSGFISLFREICAGGFDTEKGVFGIKPVGKDTNLSRWFVPKRDRTPKAQGQAGEVIEPLTIEEQTYSEIALSMQSENPVYEVTGGFHRYQILLSLIALGVLSVAQVKDMIVRCVLTDAHTDNIRDAIVKTSPFEVLKSAFFLLKQNPTERALYAPTNGQNALCTSKGGAGIYYLLYVLSRKTEKTYDDIVEILEKGKRIPSQNLRSEILKQANLEGKSFAKDCTSEKAKEILSFLSVPLPEKDSTPLDSWPDNSVRSYLVKIFQGKQWREVNEFFDYFGSEIEKLKRESESENE